MTLTQLEHVLATHETGSFSRAARACRITQAALSNSVAKARSLPPSPGSSAAIATLNDLNAEWTGGFFDESGKHFFVSIQHNVTGHGVVLDITGWR